jgi:deoxyribodipyrimidine photo-lyase
MKSRILYWFRSDLRLMDQPHLSKALAGAESFLPVYVFDPRQFMPVKNLGFPKTGAFRARFLVESVLDLRESLRDAGSDMYIAIGYPEQILPQLAAQAGCTALHAEKEDTFEEIQVEKAVQRALESSSIKLLLHAGKTLLNTLPFQLHELPDTFTAFRKKTEHLLSLINIAPELQDYPPYPHDTVGCGLNQPGDSDIIPLLNPINWTQKDPRAVMDFRGGEIEAWNRLDEYLWDKQYLSTYKQTRNGLIGQAYSSKFSAWLAHGCISARSICCEVREYEKKVEKNESTYWLLFELLWRDYFRWIARRHGNHIFYLKGIRGIKPKVRNSMQAFEKWKKGETPEPFVNANMKELENTGFMSNRGRQNVASYLCKDLQLDWRLGAAWFESMLIDYDVASNWGNWTYVAGVGNDPREDRYFNIQRQASMYDPQGTYQQLWLA